MTQGVWMSTARKTIAVGVQVEDYQASWFLLLGTINSKSGLRWGHRNGRLPVSSKRRHHDQRFYGGTRTNPAVA